jgi:hypothetical protein
LSRTLETLLDVLYPCVSLLMIMFFILYRKLRVLKKNFIKPYIWLKQGHSNARIDLTHH